MIALSFTTKEGNASSGPQTVVIVVSGAVIPDNEQPPVLKPSSELINSVNNLQPVVTTDSSQITAFIPTTQEITETTTNGKITDSVIFIDVTDPVIPTENKPFFFVEEMPEYPGGNAALLKFINENIEYPYDTRLNNIQGRVILKFVVNADGSVDRIETIKGIDPSLDSEAVRVVKSLPRFKPGKQGGVAVPVWFSLPVLFRLENNCVLKNKFKAPVSGKISGLLNKYIPFNLSDYLDSDSFCISVNNALKHLTGVFTASPVLLP